MVPCAVGVTTAAADAAAREVRGERDGVRGPGQFLVACLALVAFLLLTRLFA